MDTETLVLMALAGLAIYFALFYWVITMATKAGNKDLNDNIRQLLALKEIELKPTEQELDIAEKKIKERNKWKPLIGTAISANEYLEKIKKFDQ